MCTKCVCVCVCVCVCLFVHGTSKSMTDVVSLSYVSTQQRIFMHVHIYHIHTHLQAHLLDNRHERSRPSTATAWSRHTYPLTRATENPRRACTCKDCRKTATCPTEHACLLTGTPQTRTSTTHMVTIRAAARREARIALCRACRLRVVVCRRRAGTDTDTDTDKVQDRWTHQRRVWMTAL
jgi:hypothetical protein